MIADPFASLRLRRGETGDVGRIKKDWLLTGATSDFAKFLTPRADWMKRASELYWEWQREIVATLLGRGETWVAFWEEAPTSIVGWLVWEPKGRGRYADVPIVHMVNVLPTYRNHGVAKRLLAPALDAPKVVYTHRTLVCRHLPIPPGWTFDPRPALTPMESAA